MIVVASAPEPVEPEPDAPLSATASTALTEDDKAWLVAECKRKGVSQSAYLRRLVQIQRSLQVTAP